MGQTKIGKRSLALSRSKTQTLLMVSLLVLSAASSLVLIIDPHVAHAFHGGNQAVMGLFNEARRTNAVIDSTIPASTNIVMDVNITDAGQVNGFDVKVNFTAPLSVVGSARSGAGCSAAQGCIFASSTINVVRNVTTPTYYWLAAAVQGPPVNGNGIMFRITFRTLAGTSGVGNSALRIHDSSTIQNPSSVPYQPIHGYFDNRAAGVVNYNLTVSTTPATSPTTVIIVRPVSGSNASVAAVSLTSITGTQESANLKVLGLPLNTIGSFSSNSCTPSCSQTLTITINGGPRSAPTTTPSGIYSVVVTGNSTIGGAMMTKSAWLKLEVKPPTKPSYTLAATSTSVTQEAGNFTLLTLTANLSNGANDTVQLSTNIGSVLPGATASLTPSSGSFPLVSIMNVTSPPTSSVGPRTFNITATTAGTYSEVPVRKDLVFTLTVLRTHDPAVASEAVSRNFAYTGVSLSPTNRIQTNVTVSNLGTVSETFTVNATAKVFLSGDSKIVFVDTTRNFRWDPGEAVAYDSNTNGAYDAGEPAISGSPSAGALLIGDPGLGYVESNFNNRWDIGESVTYDTNANTLYDIGENVIGGPAPSPGYFIGSGAVTLSPSAQTTVTFAWDPVSISRGKYVISSQTTKVSGEFRLENNVVSSFSFTQKFKGDVSGDCRVDIVDLATVGSTFGKTIGQVGYNAAADLNNDGVINIVDLVLVAGSFGQVC